jgi:MFS family permease
VQFTRHASLIVFAALAVIMAIGAVLTALSAETAPPRPGAARSLVPHVVVPRAARREFTAAVPVHLAAWMLSGLFLGLVPTIIQDLFGLHGGLLNGASVFVLPETAAVAGFFLGRFTPRRTTLIGGVSVLAGTALVVGGVATEVLPLLWAGGLIGGAGFGASFSGAMRSITPLVQVHQRAGLFAAVYLVAYLSFGVPAIIAGQLVGPVGLLATVIGYGIAIILAASAGLVAQLRNART